MSRGQAQVAAMAERFARYCTLRDQGIEQSDAAREIGIEPAGTGGRYERSYREARGLERRRPGSHVRAHGHQAGEF